MFFMQILYSIFSLLKLKDEYGISYLGFLYFHLFYVYLHCTNVILQRLEIFILFYSYFYLFLYYYYYYHYCVFFAWGGGGERGGGKMGEGYGVHEISNSFHSRHSSLTSPNTPEIEANAGSILPKLKLHCITPLGNKSEWSIIDCVPRKGISEHHTKPSLFHLNENCLQISSFSLPFISQTTCKKKKKSHINKLHYSFSEMQKPAIEIMSGPVRESEKEWMVAYVAPSTIHLVIQGRGDMHQKPATGWWKSNNLFLWLRLQIENNCTLMKTWLSFQGK